MDRREFIQSQKISDFIGYVEQAKKDYEIGYLKVGDSDKAQGDFNHMMEQCTSCKERSKIATQMHYLRRDRRYWKDIYVVNEEISKFFNEPQNAKMLNQLKEILGRTRKAENHIKGNRKYIPRIIKNTQ